MILQSTVCGGGLVVTDGVTVTLPGDGEDSEGLSCQYPPFGAASTVTVVTKQ